MRGLIASSSAVLLLLLSTLTTVTTTTVEGLLLHPQRMGMDGTAPSSAPRDAAPAALLTNELLMHARNKNATGVADLIDDSAEIFISSMDCAPITKSQFVTVATNYSGYRGFWARVDFSAYRTVFMTLFGGMVAEEKERSNATYYGASPIFGIKIIAEASEDGTKITKFLEHIPEEQGRNPAPKDNKTLIDVWTRMSSACENHNATALGENMAEDFVGNVALFEGQTKPAPTFTKAQTLAGLAPTFKAQRLDQITSDPANGNALFADKCGNVVTTYTELMAYDVNSMPGAPWPESGMFHSFSLIKVNTTTRLAEEWTVVSEIIYFKK